MCAYRSMKFILCAKAALLAKEGAARAVRTVHMVHQGSRVFARIHEPWCASALHVTPSLRSKSWGPCCAAWHSTRDT